MGLGLSPFVVAGARDQMRADEQMEWQREDQQFRRGQREREVKRAAVADELMGDQMADYRDERAFTRGMRDTTVQNAGASRFDFTTALEQFARRNGRVELADKFRSDRENGNIDIMKRVVTAASSGADATRIAAILNEGRPAAERIDPAALQLQTDASGRTTGLVMRGPQGRPVPINLGEWGLMTGLVKPTKIDIKDNAMVVANGDGSQSIVTFENGRLVFKKNPNHVPDPERGPGRGSGAGGGGAGGAGTQMALEKAIDDFIESMPGMTVRDPVDPSKKGPRTQQSIDLRDRASMLIAGARQGALTNGRVGDSRPVPFDSPTGIIRVANHPSGQWKDVKVTINGQEKRTTAWVINDAASGGEVAYFPDRPIYRDVDRSETVMERLRASRGFEQGIAIAREHMNDPNAEAVMEQILAPLAGPGAGRVLMSYVRDLQRPQDEQTMPVGEGSRAPVQSAAAAPAFGQPGGVSGGIARGMGAVAGAVGGIAQSALTPQADQPVVGGIVGQAPRMTMDPTSESTRPELDMPSMPAGGPDIAPRFRGGPQGAPRASAPGMVEPGNIDLRNRPRVNNADGSVSTIKSVGVNLGGKEVLLPTIDDSGREMSVDEAVAQYRRTGRHLGIFRDARSATAYAQRLSAEQGQRVARGIPQQ